MTGGGGAEGIEAGIGGADGAPPQRGAAARSRGDSARTIYDALKRDIVEMAITPGEPLDEVRLSERFAMSRTPVREALVRLAAEGLVATLPNRNTVVTSLDLANLPEYFDALTLIYRVTARLAAIRRTDADLEGLRAHQAAFAAAVAGSDVPGMIATNRDFHLAVARAGRNKYYSELSSRLLDEGRRILRIYYSSFNDRLPREFVDEHEAMIDSIETQDADLADRLAADHALQIMRRIQSFIGEGVGRDLVLGANAGAPGPARKAGRPPPPRSSP